IERLQKAIARSGVASRRAAERMIREGRVTVNGQPVARLGVRVDLDRDVIRVDEKRLPAPPRGSTYVLMNKPRGDVTTLADPEGRPTVRDLLDGLPTRVYPVGRLDYDSEGLLLLTDDGGLARGLMHPSSTVEKTYVAKVRGTPSADAMQRLRRGVRVLGR